MSKQKLRTCLEEKLPNNPKLVDRILELEEERGTCFRLSGMFYWAKTKEEHKFWSGVSDFISGDSEYLPQMPTHLQEETLTKKEQPKQKTFIIGIINSSGTLEFSKKPHYHTTEESVTKEAERLAIEYPGTEFVILQVIKSASTQPPKVEWK